MVQYRSKIHVSILHAFRTSAASISAIYKLHWSIQVQHNAWTSIFRTNVFACDKITFLKTFSTFASVHHTFVQSFVYLPNTNEHARACFTRIFRYGVFLKAMKKIDLKITDLYQSLLVFLNYWKSLW
jgi:hypothetical protein